MSVPSVGGTGTDLAGPDLIFKLEFQAIKNVPEIPGPEKVRPLHDAPALLIKPLFSTLSDKTRELGWLNLLFLLADRLLAAISRGTLRIYRYALVAQPVMSTPLLPAHRGADIRVQEIFEHDPLFAQCPRPATVIAGRFAQGARCIAATRAGQFAGFIWLNHPRYLEDEVRVSYELPADGSCVWDFDVYVDPTHRMSFVFLKLWEAVYADLRAQGVGWSISRIATANIASLAAHRRLRARIFAHAVFVVVGPLQIMGSSCFPFLAVGLKRAPRLRIPRPPINAQD